MQALCSKYGFPHVVNRDDIYESTLSLYKKDQDVILDEFPFRIKYNGERAIDSGGVSRDFCSAFWESAYEKAFDGNTLLTPALHSSINLESLTVIGTILSHMYLAVGFIPVRIAFPTLACIFLHPNVSIPDEFMVEAFIDSLSAHERECMCSAVKICNEGGYFSDQVKQQLTVILSRYGGRRIPSAKNIKDLLLSTNS